MVQQDISNETVQRIINLRNKNNLTQSQLAKKIGVGNTIISKIEKGIRGISAEELANIAKVFNVSTDYLLGIKNKVPENKNFDIGKAIDNDEYMTNHGKQLTDKEKAMLKALFGE